ncbi:virion structural protein [Pseudomonas phage PA1C]|uniref:Uncharacterized protein n=1 Tax=Pseudomonas phage vB_PaeM_PS119XW TaxID=2601632 RepID=A0A5C1K7S5_9CAUD|nr:virion structural protein [Pseudomonas phage vB_PaeM_PS119XW]QBX32241.1 virion structural protein [Pseudomonas phage PA1C]QEM41819.1 hypothetical protein [Pseudomonas phage vB_PaeM_PS119XW]BEG72727.1 hypothetical protein RVBP21_3550 [Pseudomonas phage BRkr]
MRTGFEIARILKEIKSPTNNDRQARAMFVANAVGFFVQLDPSLSCEELIDAHMPMLKKVAGQVNENIALDLNLTRELFKQVIRIRLELINCVSDPAIIEAAMKSVTAEDYQTIDETATANMLASRFDFAKSQNAIASVLRQLEVEG